MNSNTKNASNDKGTPDNGSPLHAQPELVDSSPELSSNIFSRIFYLWAQPLFRRASNLHKEQKALEQEDLLDLPLIDHGQVIAPAFEEAWSKQIPISEATIGTAIRAVIGKRFIFAGFIKILNTGLQFTFPILLSEMLKYIEETQSGVIGRKEDEPWQVTYRGYWLSALLFLAMTSKAITENLYFHSVYRAGYQARIAVSVAVYNKALRLASAERHGTTLGELINLMQVDATKIEMFVPQIHVLWDGLLQIIGYMTILYTLIGWPCFAGLAVMVLAGPLQGFIMKKLFSQNRELVKYTDSRVKTTNEAVQGVRCVKMYTWEDSFQKVISGSRSGELKFLAKVAYLRGFSRAYMGALPGIVAVVSFVVYAVAYKGATINASTLFAALVAFDQLRFPLMFYPMSLAQLAQAKVSALRVEGFLRLKEVCNQTVSTDGQVTATYDREDDSLKTGEIKVHDACIFWGDPNVPIQDNDAVDDASSVGASSTQSKGSTKKKSDGKSSKTTKDEVGDVEEAQELKYPKAILSNVSFNVVPGELCAVVGRVGCGKSTLVSAILNETIIDSGHIGLNGTVAYAAQSPWILNATLRDNITFGKPFDQEKYDKIVSACQLNHDLALLDHGDMTEIGENGINLSGGQRQRVSIARAAYADTDIIILDDPLSALDPEVGKNLFDECILKLMRGKTRVLVTNQLQCLRFCDSVIAIGKGKIIEQGPFDVLSKHDGEVKRLLADLKSSEAQSSDSEGQGRARSDSEASTERKRGESVSEETKTKADTGKGSAGLVTEEERNVGAVSWQVYKKYISSGGGYLRFTFVYFMFMLCTANNVINTAWVSLWTSDAKYERNSRTFYLGFYALTSITLGIFTFFRSYFLAKFGVRASDDLHKNLLKSVLSAPMSFFDSTPTGRILSRFSKDLYAIDLELSDYLDFFLFCGLTVVVSLITIVIVTPWFGIAVIPIFFIYVKVLNYFREVSRETKRLDSISRSPVFAHFSETLGGLGTIRAYGQADRFINEFEEKVDTNTRAYYNNKSADRWLSVRLEMLGAFIAGLAAVFASNVAISNAQSGLSSSKNFASVAGLSLTYAISVTGLLNWVVRSFAQMEAAMNAAERVLFYTQNIPQEAPASKDELKRIMHQDSNIQQDDEKKSNAVKQALVAMGGTENPGPEWPSKGGITLNNLKMRYRPDNPLVINGLNVEIKGGERVGVVGRTGSGKSSLLLTLLRIVEPFVDPDEEYQSPILIDGVDVLRIGLTDLRSKIGIIPQNPVLFSGTIRSNMDPFDQYTDEEIWHALERCGMKKSIEEMPELLNARVAEYGENLSQGQRQLLCLGRALLKKCRILLLDEATSSVDFETDKEIQRTLREDFANCTVLTIAHRVNTIMDSDKILVMKDGKVGEFASPEELLADKNSIFYDIVKHSHAEHHA